MNCDEFRSASLAGRGNNDTRRHEQSCAACRSQAADLRAAYESLSDPAVWEEPSPELATQVEDLIRNASRGSSAQTDIRARTWARVLVPAAVLVVAVATVLIVTRSASPDWEVALPATDLAPGATATVQGWNEDAGTRMIVALDGLVPAPDGFIYEFWLSDGPIHVSAGTFHSSGEIELWSGVTRADYPRLWITVEPIDEDESPSGQTVLDTGRDA